jgi:hypothetical protein
MHVGFVNKKVDGDEFTRHVPQVRGVVPQLAQLFATMTLRPTQHTCL